MKLSEVIAELENGSTKTYEAYAEDGERIQMSREGKYPNFQKFSYMGTPREQRSECGYFSGNCKLGLDWSPIRTSVPWDEAIRGWASGKEICCEVGGVKFTPDDEEFGNEFSITRRMINLGVWYAEN